jgi:hypothetical protein
MCSCVPAFTGAAWRENSLRFKGVPGVPETNLQEHQEHAKSPRRSCAKPLWDLIEREEHQERQKYKG